MARFSVLLAGLSQMGTLFSRVPWPDEAARRRVTFELTSPPSRQDDTECCICAYCMLLVLSSRRRLPGLMHSSISPSLGDDDGLVSPKSLASEDHQPWEDAPGPRGTVSAHDSVWRQAAQHPPQTGPGPSYRTNGTHDVRSNGQVSKRLSTDTAGRCLPTTVEYSYL